MNETLHNVLQQQNNTPDSVFGLKNNDQEFNCLLYIYWFQKTHKIPSGARFIIPGKKCYSQIDAYHKKKHFSGTKTFWVIQNNSL